MPLLPLDLVVLLLLLLLLLLLRLRRRFTCIKIYLIACRRCGPFSHSNHSSWLVVVVGFRHAIMQIYTAPLAITLAIYTPVACRQRRRHSQLYVRCLSS